jgi:hypothetical protein
LNFGAIVQAFSRLFYHCVAWVSTIVAHNKHKNSPYAITFGASSSSEDSTAEGFLLFSAHALPFPFMLFGFPAFGKGGSAGEALFFNAHKVVSNFAFHFLDAGELSS